jgi:hypothetical protein
VAVGPEPVEGVGVGVGCGLFAYVEPGKTEQMAKKMHSEIVETFKNVFIVRKYILLESRINSCNTPHTLDNNWSI